MTETVREPPGSIQCAFPDCSNPKMSTLDTCKSHRRQQLRGESLAPLMSRSGKPKDGRKICSWCREWVPLEQFYLYASRSKNKYYPACNECRTEYHKYTAISNKYKLSRVQYDRLVADGCNICGSHHKLVVDHDHDCCPRDYTCGQCIRGILCGRCNLGLGKFDDDVGKLLAAVDYLKGKNDCKIQK